MTDEVLHILQDPYTKHKLELQQGTLINQECQKEYPYKNGYYSFVSGKELNGNNKKYSRLYSKFAFIYTLANRVYFFFKFGSEFKARSEYLNELDIKDNAKVLEVSIGTGDNLLYLNHRARFYGIDISKKMLTTAVKHLLKWKIPTFLGRCEAENLPFKDNVFDVVFHIGGINYFNDKQKAIHEMIRVAKPGTKLMIVDETEKCVEKIYQCTPLSKKYFPDVSAAAAPVHLVPPEMQDISVKIVNDGLFYCITFKKPIPETIPS